MDTLSHHFHSLDGATISEKRKNFNLFLKTLESSVHDANELRDFISSVTPMNPTEELFRLEMVIKFRQYTLLKNELKANSPLVVRKLLKDWKAFADLILNINVQIVINDIFPYVSFALKSKLIHGICKNVKNETLLDEYFLALEKKYGLKTAAILLPGCTLNLIRSKITLISSKLTNRQLRSVFKKDNKFVEYYFDILQRKYSNFNFLSNYKQTLMFIAKVDASLYWKLCEKYLFHLRFGKRMTVKMIRANNDIVNDGNKYINDFKLLPLYKTMKKDGNLKQFLLNVFPETIEQYPDIHEKYDLSFFIDIIYKHEPYSTVVSAFKEKYDQNLLDYPQFCKEEFIKSIPVNERDDLLNMLVKNDEKLLYLYHTSKSIPILKKKLQHSSDANNRAQLIILMYKTCAVNKDKDALLETLHFILNRYKNDINVVTTFFNHVVGWPGITMLEEKYWKYIVDMAKIIEMTKETFYHDKFYSKYMCHLLENNADYGEQCRDPIKRLFQNLGIYVDIDKKHEKRYIELMGEYLHLLKDHKDYKNMCIHFLSYVANYNTRCKTTQIPFNKYDCLFEQVKNAESSHVMQTVITFGVKNCQFEFWDSLFWNNQEQILNYQSFDILYWYLKNHPEKIGENINKVVSWFSMYTYRLETFFRQARKFLDNDTSEKLKTHALTILHSEDRAKIKCAFRIISIFKPETLSETILPLLTNPDIETNLKKKENRILRRILIQRLHKLGDPLYIFPLVPKFCIRYYYKCCLSPLKSLACRTPELHVKRNLMQFSGKVLCIKKQILILAKDVLISKEYIKLLDESSELETHVSIKNIIFMKTLQHFIENPSDSLWTLTNKNLKLIDKEDRDIYNVLLKFEKIPQQYLSLYIEAIFKEVSNSADNEIKKKKFELLDSIPTHIIDNLDIEFLKHIVADTACLENVSNFHWKCVFYTQEEKQGQLFEKNFETLKHFLEVNGVNSHKDTKVKSVISNFLNRFLNITLELKKGNTLIEKFILVWASIFQPFLFCQDYTTLLFADLYFKSNFEAFQTGTKINELLYNYIENYSASILPLFSKILTRFLEKVSIQKQEQLIKFIEGFTNNKFSENIYVVLMYVLPEISKMKSSGHYKQISILKDIQDCTNPFIKFHYDVYLAKNELNT